MPPVVKLVVHLLNNRLNNQLYQPRPDTIKEYKKARKELSSASDDAAVSEGAFPDAMGEGKAVPLPGTSGGGREAVPEPEGKASAVQGVAPVPRRPSRSGVDGGQAFYVSAKGRRLSGQALADFEAFWDAYGLPAREGGSGGYVACGYAQGP